MEYKHLYDSASRNDYLSQQMSELGKEGFRFVALIPAQETVEWQNTPKAYVHIIMAKDNKAVEDSWQNVGETAIDGLYECRLKQGDTPKEAMAFVMKRLEVEP